MSLSGALRASRLKPSSARTSSWVCGLSFHLAPMATSRHLMILRRMTALSPSTTSSDRAIFIAMGGNGIRVAVLLLVVAATCILGSTAFRELKMIQQILMIAFLVITSTTFPAKAETTLDSSDASPQAFVTSQCFTCVAKIKCIASENMLSIQIEDKDSQTGRASHTWETYDPRTGKKTGTWLGQGTDFSSMTQSVAGGQIEFLFEYADPPEVMRFRRFIFPVSACVFFSVN